MTAPYYVNYIFCIFPGHDLVGSQVTAILRFLASALSLTSIGMCAGITFGCANVAMCVEMLKHLGFCAKERVGQTFKDRSAKIFIVSDHIGSIGPNWKKLNFQIANDWNVQLCIKYNISNQQNAKQSWKDDVHCLPLIWKDSYNTLKKTDCKPSCIMSDFYSFIGSAYILIYISVFFLTFFMLLYF